ncbi:MAG: DUF5786 family protein [Salinarchaeum sp.]
MSLGAYDEDEHERREEKSTHVDAAFDDHRHVYQGTVEYDNGESTEDLLETFKDIKS